MQELNHQLEQYQLASYLSVGLQQEPVEVLCSAVAVDYVSDSDLHMLVVLPSLSCG